MSVLFLVLLILQILGGEGKERVSSHSSHHGTHHSTHRHHNTSKKAVFKRGAPQRHSPHGQHGKRSIVPEHITEVGGDDGWFDKIYVLSLKRRTDRHHHMNQYRQLLGDFEFYQATDATTLLFNNSYLGVVWNVVRRKLLTHPECAKYLAGGVPSQECRILIAGSTKTAIYMSDINVFEDAIHHGYRRILFLEDDVWLPKEYNATRTPAARQFNLKEHMKAAMRVADPDWKFLYFGHCLSHANDKLEDPITIPSKWDFHLHRTESANCPHALGMQLDKHDWAKLMEYLKIGLGLRANDQRLGAAIKDLDYKTFIVDPPLLDQGWQARGIDKFESDTDAAGKKKHMAYELLRQFGEY